MLALAVKTWVHDTREGDVDDRTWTGDVFRTHVGGDDYDLLVSAVVIADVAAVRGVYINAEKATLQGGAGCAP